MLTDEQVQEMLDEGRVLNSRFVGRCKYCVKPIGVDELIFWIPADNTYFHGKTSAAHYDCIKNHVFNQKKKEERKQEERKQKERKQEEQKQKPPPKPPPKTEPPSTLAKALKQVMYGLPEGMRRKTYISLAKCWHPDTGGDTEIMKVLTTVWDEVS